MTSDLVIYGGITIAAYLVGSIPFGLIFTKMAGKGDIRAIGSGNIGTTNVLRTGSKFLAAMTLLFDAGKGAAIVMIAMSYGDLTTGSVAGLAVVIGHCFPIWLGFKGGKGVATALAVFAAYAPLLGGLFIVLWLLMALVFRYSSLAALTATLGTTICAFILDIPVSVCLSMTFITGLVWARHHQNIGRLLSGQESKIGKS